MSDDRRPTAEQPGDDVPVFIVLDNAKLGELLDHLDAVNGPVPDEVDRMWPTAADASQPSLRWMPDGRLMQCKDIPDELFLDAVRRSPGLTEHPGSWRMRWNVHAELETDVGPIPERLFLAKARGLMARGLLGGCACGCRGDYHLPEHCEGGRVCCRSREITIYTAEEQS